MATTREDIRGWLMRGKEKGATHMIVACDTFDHEDYPVYVMPGEDARTKASEYSGKNMQRVMEVYSYSLPLDVQMSEFRAFHYD